MGTTAIGSPESLDRRAAEERMARSVDEFYRGVTPPPPIGVLPDEVDTPDTADTADGPRGLARAGGRKRSAEPATVSRMYESPARLVREFHEVFRLARGRAG